MHMIHDLAWINIRAYLAKSKQRKIKQVVSLYRLVCLHTEVSLMCGR